MPFAVDHCLEITQPLVTPDRIVAIRIAKASPSQVGSDDLLALGKIAGNVGNNMGCATLLCKAHILGSENVTIESKS